MCRKLKKGTSLITAMLLIGLIILNPFFVNANGSTYLQRLNNLTKDKYPSGHYLTREELCVIVSKIFLTEQEAEATALPFADVSQIKPESVPHLSALYRDGILRGINEEGIAYMKPGEKITRQDAATILGQVLSKSSSYKLAFTDAEDISGYAYPYVSWLGENKIIVGYPDGSFAPKNNVTAGEFAVMAITALDFITFSDAEVKTIFGTGSQGLIDGELASGRFSLPYGVAVDNNGNVVVADTYNNALRRIESDTLTTIAGSIKGIDNEGFPQGFLLDGEMKSALLNRPTNAVINSKGWIFIADSANSVIRFTRDGKMYTYSGTTAGFKDGSDDVAQFNRPTAVALDRNENLFVADTLNNCIRKIDSQGNVTTIAGTPGQAGFMDGYAKEALFREPAGIAIGSDGSIYVADTGNHRIRKIKDGRVATIAGTTTETDADDYPIGGFKDDTAKSAMFNRPRGLAVADGMLIIADSANNRIRLITPSNEVKTIIGNGEPGDQDGDAPGAMLHHPVGLCYHDGMLYIADTSNNKIKGMAFDPTVFKTRGE